jgi:hypothetical protein
MPDLTINSIVTPNVLLNIWGRCYIKDLSL